MALESERDLVGMQGSVGLCRSSRHSPHWNVYASIRAKQPSCWNVEAQCREIDIYSRAGPKSLTRTLEAKGDNVKYSFEGVSTEGTNVAYNSF
jgi:hypothetical protein